MDGPVHVKAMLYRGQVLDEAAHKDFWGENDTLVLREYTEATVIPTQCCQNRAGYQSLRLPARVLVPPGTGKMRVEFLATYTGAAGPQPHDLDYTLTWKTNAINPQTDTITDWSSATPVVDEKNHKVWEFDVGRNETDAYYQVLSNWEWKPWPKPFTEDGVWLETRGRTFYLGVQVWKDPDY
jgi:hypothetical protein